MKSKTFFIFLIIILCSACAPKYSYIDRNTPVGKFDRIAVVIDYVNFMDGIGELMDYDVLKNKAQIAKIKSIIKKTLSRNDSGNHLDFVLFSSGVGFNPDMPFESYHDGERQTDLIYPPFFIDSYYPPIVQDQLLNSLMEAQRIALTPASKANQNYLQRVRITPINFNEHNRYSQKENSPRETTAILHIRVIVPRVSFLKTLGSSVVSVGISSGSVRGSHVGIGLPLTSGNKSQTTALLYDNETGQVLWKNQRSSDLSQLDHEAVMHFFKDFTTAP